MKSFPVYSPVNGRVVDFGNFNHCNLRKPPPEFPPPMPDGKPCCIKEVIAPEIEWEEWAVFAPYIGVGIAGFDEEIATWYAAQSGAEFATRSKALQRSIWVQVKPKLTVYDLNIPDLEKVDELLAVIDGDHRYYTGSYNRQYGKVGVVRDNVFHANDWFVDRPKNVELIVSATPLQGVMHFDRTLFDDYLDPIANHARLLYLTRVAPKYEALSIVAQQDNFFQAARAAKQKNTQWLTELRKHTVEPKASIWG